MAALEWLLMNMLKNVALAVVCGSVAPSFAETVTLQPSADATLYEPLGEVTSNGGGDFLFAGRIREGQLRRALLKFDFSSIPAGSTITSVSLTLTVSRSISGPASTSLHRVTASWGEGTTDAGEPGGQGTTAQPGDATWFHRFFNTTNWTTAGGDFVAGVSSSTQVGGLGSFTWTGPGLAADVQAWLDQTAPNHGWILLGDEPNNFNAKRFNSRENASASSRPTLVVAFAPPSALCLGDANGDNVVSFDDVTSVLGNFSASYGAGNTGPGDANGDGSVNFDDVTTVLGNFGLVCP